MWTWGRGLVGAGVVLTLAGSASHAHAAGFFDALGDLLGVRRPEPQVVQVPDDGLSLTVRPRHRSLARPARTSEPRKVANTAIDPVENPNWYLQDHTMRKGDVIVLKGEVLIFNGGRAPYTRADFSSLSESRLVSRPLRDKIRAMAGLPPDHIGGVAVKRADSGRSHTTAE